MTLLQKDSVAVTTAGSSYPPPHTLPAGRLAWRHLTDAGGLTQFGAALETLFPGGQSSRMHWESDEDEFLYMLEGTLTLIEDGLERPVHPGDACIWKAGVPVGHCLRNDGDNPATYLIVGSRRADNITHYPGLDMLATPRGYTRLDGMPYPSTGEDEE